jgi:hypothetical protein
MWQPEDTEDTGVEIFESGTQKKTMSIGDQSG